MKRLMIIFALFSFTQDNAAEIEAITRGERKSLLINEVGFWQQKKKFSRKERNASISYNIIQLPKEVKIIIFGKFYGISAEKIGEFCNKNKEFSVNMPLRYFYKYQDCPIIINNKQLNYIDALRLSEEQRSTLQNLSNPHVIDRWMGREKDVFYNEEIDSLKAVPSHIKKGYTVTTKKSHCPCCYQSNKRYCMPCALAAGGFFQAGLAGIFWCTGVTVFNVMGYMSAAYFLGVPVAGLCAACAEECCTTVEERTF